MEQHFIGGLAGYEELAVSQTALSERRIDHDLVLAGLHRLELSVAHAEAPRLLVVRRTVGDRIRPVGQRMKPRPQFLEAHAGPHRGAVLHHVKVVPTEVNDPFAALIGHVCVSDIPLQWNGPIEHLGTGGYFVDRQRNHLAEHSKALTHALARDTATDRIQPRDERVHPFAESSFSACGCVRVNHSVHLAHASFIWLTLPAWPSAVR